MPYNILLVDDDSSFREELKCALEDYNAIEAASGEEALEKLRQPNEIDLVVLDVVMPGMRGTEVLKEIKKCYPELGVIMLTGHSSKDVAVESLKGRADDYIEKPVDPVRLIEAIERLLKAKNGRDKIDECDIKGKMEHVKRFIERNYHKMVSLDDAAVVAGISPKYLSRAFMEAAGIGFNEYKTKIKIEKAKEWLETSGYDVNQIASKLGYQNVESFIRAFKKYTRSTPSHYRKDPGARG